MSALPPLIGQPYRLLVLACSASKIEQAAQRTTHAAALYDGPGWRTYRRWRRDNPVGALRLNVLALSAEYGLIDAYCSTIKTYDRKLTADRIPELVSADARADLAEQLDEYRIEDVLLFGGALYADLFEQLMPVDHYWRRAGEGEGIGYQLAELREWLGGNGAAG